MAAFDLKEILLPPRKITWKSAPNALQDRELGRSPSFVGAGYSPGFTPDAIRSMTRSFSYKHAGCVNTANFSDDGTLLVTGSDDLKLKIWKSSSGCSPTKKNGNQVQHEIITGHHSNIFHAMVSFWGKLSLLF